jgi:hypothetical protein
LIVTMDSTTSSRNEPTNAAASHAPRHRTSGSDPDGCWPAAQANVQPFLASATREQPDAVICRNSPAAPVGRTHPPPSPATQPTPTSRPPTCWRPSSRITHTWQPHSVTSNSGTAAVVPVTPTTRITTRATHRQPDHALPERRKIEANHYRSLRNSPPQT